MINVVYHVWNQWFFCLWISQKISQMHLKWKKNCHSPDYSILLHNAVYICTGGSFVLMVNLTVKVKRLIGSDDSKKTFTVMFIPSK